MTDQYDHEGQYAHEGQYEAEYAYLTGTDGESRPSTFRLALIPLVVTSLIGLAAGFSALTRASAARTARALAAGETATAVPAGLPARPDAAIVDRTVRALMTVATTTTTAPAATSTTTTAPSAPAVYDQSMVASAPTSGCGAALQWLSAHAAPGFSFECPGYALGHQAMTCVDEAGVCPGERIIAIADACPAAYMNEAHNSWILAGLATGRLDPYGYCS